jgi:ribosomal protein S14
MAVDHSEVTRQVEAEFACNCTLRVLTYKVAANGVRHYRMQCRRCGNGTPVRKSDYEPQQLESADEWDDEIGKEWGHKRFAGQTELLQAIRDDESSQWWQKYNEYLESDEWRAKRKRVLMRDMWLCQACLRRKATQVHHRTYEHVFNEPLFDLVSVCQTCHDELTRTSRGE